MSTLISCSGSGCRGLEAPLLQHKTHALYFSFVHLCALAALSARSMLCSSHFSDSAVLLCARAAVGASCEVDAWRSGTAATQSRAEHCNSRLRASASSPMLLRPAQRLGAGVRGWVMRRLRPCGLQQQIPVRLPWCSFQPSVEAWAHHWRRGPFLTNPQWRPATLSWWLESLIRT